MPEPQQNISPEVLAALQQMIASGGEDIDPDVFNLLWKAIQDETFPLSPGILFSYLKHDFGGRLTPGSNLLWDLALSVEASRRDIQAADRKADQAQKDYALALRRVQNEEAGADADAGRFAQERQDAQEKAREARLQWAQEFNFSRQKWAGQMQEAGFDRDLQRELLSTRLSFEREQLGVQTGLELSRQQLQAQQAVLGAAVQDPYAFAALRVLAEQPQRLAAEQGFQKAQAEFQTQQAQREQQTNKAQQILGQDQAMRQAFADAGQRGELTASSNTQFSFLSPIWQGQVDEARRVMGLPALVAPTTPNIQRTPYEQELGQFGFGLPALATLTSNLPIQQFFGGRTPSLGVFSSLTPESRQFLTSVAGFQGLSPGALQQQAAGVTPGSLEEQERRRRRVLPAMAPAGVR